ncbi:SGNH/GDSL hydrolase family protein [Candidatus Neomarinimicrobiota bacterium]
MKIKWLYCYLVLSIVLSIVLFSCKKTTESNVEWGNADFSSFVSIGNSLTAGMSDAALYEDAQKTSFPNLIAKAVEIDNFQQPLIGGNGYSLDEKKGRLSFTGTTIDYLSPGTEKNRNLNRAYNNLGIPSITVKDAYSAKMPADAENNHFIDKILRNSGRTQIEEALSLSPTLITLWIGINDVLKSASMGLADYTDPAEFESHFKNMMNELTAGTDAPILVANLLDLTDLPFFTGIPSSVNKGGNKVYYFGECKNGVRRLTDDDHVLLPATNEYINYVNSDNITQDNALNDSLILDSEEKNEVQQILNEYNDIIGDIVNQNTQLHLVDIYTLFKNIELNGCQIGGIKYTKDVITFDENGIPNLNFVSLFSLDGLHPNQFGYTCIANTFIEKINSIFNTDISIIN